MLFMGEEWGARHALAVLHRPRRGVAGRGHPRGRGGGSSPRTAGPRRTCPTRRTRRRPAVQLDWAEPAGEPHAELLDWYRALIALRRARPELTDPRLDRVAVRYDEERALAGRRARRAAIVASLADVPLLVPLPEPPTAILAASRPGVRLGDTTVTMPAAALAVLDDRAGGRPALRVGAVDC